MQHLMAGRQAGACASQVSGSWQRAAAGAFGRLDIDELRAAASGARGMDNWIVHTRAQVDSLMASGGSAADQQALARYLHGQLAGAPGSQSSSRGFRWRRHCGAGRNRWGSVFRKRRQQDQNWLGGEIVETPIR
jgi:hypothetical protein